MNSWPRAQLQDVVVDMQPGFAQRPDANGVGTPQLRTNNVGPDGALDLSNIRYVSASAAQLNKYCVKSGDVIFNNTNSVQWVGKAAYFDLEDTYVLSNHMTRLRVNESLLDARFLAYYLHYLWKTGSSRSRSKQWVNQAALDKGELSAFEVPLPPLIEQRRIVAILMQASELRRLRYEALKKARQLFSSLYSVMFEATEGNREAWPVESLKSLGQINYGLTVNSRRREAQNKLPYLRVANVYRWALDLTETSYIGTLKGDLDKYALVVGDVLVVEGHADPNQLGRAAVWSAEIPGCLHQNHLLRVRPDSSLITPNYLMSCINSSSGLQYMLRHGKTSSGLNTINSKVLAEMPIVRPPLKVQMEFENRYAACKRIVSKCKQAAAELDNLFQSLLAQASSGELTKAWREQHEHSLAADAIERDRLLEQVGSRPVKAFRDWEELQFRLDQIAPVKDRVGPPHRRDFTGALSLEQQCLMRMVSNYKSYFTPEHVHRDQDTDQYSRLTLDSVRRGLALLAATGVIAPVTLPQSTSGVPIFALAYRTLWDEDKHGSGEDGERTSSNSEASLP